MLCNPRTCQTEKWEECQTLEFAGLCSSQEELRELSLSCEHSLGMGKILPPVCGVWEASEALWIWRVRRKMANAFRSRLERKVTACIRAGLWNQVKKEEHHMPRVRNHYMKLDTLVKSVEEGNLRQNHEVTTSGQLYAGKQQSQEVTVLLWGQIY